jgi:hypothetical protein
LLYVGGVFFAAAFVRWNFSYSISAYVLCPTACEVLVSQSLECLFLSYVFRDVLTALLKQVDTVVALLASTIRVKEVCVFFMFSRAQ